MDPRFKLICIILYTTAGLSAKLSGLIALTVILTLGLILSHQPMVKMLKEIRAFSFLLLMIILSRAMSHGGRDIISGFFLAWGLLLILILGSLLIATTPIDRLRNGVKWFFRRIPFLPSGRIAVMLGLTVALVPLIFDQASEMRDAQKARCIDLNKNPIKRIKLFAYPLLSRTLRRADEIAYAMESRCYCDDRTEVLLKANPRDWLILLVSAAICSAVWYSSKF